MGVIDYFFGDKIAQSVQEKLTSAYNTHIFQWLNNGQPVYLNDKPGTYVHDGFMGAGAVYECVDLILKKLTACPAIIYEVKDEKQLKKYLNYMQSDSIDCKAKAMQIKASALEEVSPKEIQDILDRPNEMQDLTAFIEMLAGYFLLTGNSYIYKNGPDPDQQKWKEMFVLPAAHMQIISGGMFEPVKGYNLTTGNNSKIAFEANQVEHMKTFNPDFTTTGAQLYGMSPLRAYLRTLARTKAGDKEINKQLTNGGAYGVLAPKNAQDLFTPDQKTALKEQLIAAKNSPDEVSRILPASVSLEWTQIGLPYGDMKLLDTLQAADEDIYRAYHVPLQFRSTDSSTFNNQSVAGKQLIYNAVEPVASRIAATLTQALCAPVNERRGKRYMIKLDTSSLPEMSENMKEIADWLYKSPELTLNERREVKGWGKLSNVPNMDIPLVPKGWVPVDMVGLDGVDFSSAFDKVNKE